jgi:hypothetical protein
MEMGSTPFLSTNKNQLDEGMVYSSLQHSVSACSRAEVIIRHTPSTSDVCEMLAQSLGKSIA